MFFPRMDQSSVFVQHTVTYPCYLFFFIIHISFFKVYQTVINIKKKMIDESEIDRIYSQQLHEELINQTRITANQLIKAYPHAFGLENLISKSQYVTHQSINDTIAQLIRDTCLAYIENNIQFNHAQVRKSKRRTFFIDILIE